MAVGRQFGREASIYLAGFVGAGIIQFLSIPIYTRALGPEQYGYLALVIASTTVLSGIILLGGDVALARFWVDAHDERAKRELASTWIGFLSLWSIIVAALACALAPWMAGRLAPGAGLAVMLAIGFLGQVPAQISRMLAQILRNRFRPVPYAATTVLVTSLNVALGIALGIGMDMGVLGIVLGMLIGEALGAAIRVPLVRGSVGRNLNRSLLPPLLRFGVPLVPASLAAWVFTGMDRIVVGLTLDQLELGAYGLAATLIGPFTVFTLAIGQAWIPRIASLHALDRAGAQRATSQGIALALAGLGTAAIAVGTLSPWLIAVVGGPGYEAGVPALPFLAAGAAFYGTAVFTATGLTLEKRTTFIPVVTVGAAALDIALLFLLVPRWGLIGASVSVASAYLCLAWLSLVFAHRVFPLSVNVGRLALMTLLLMVQAGMAATLPGSMVTGATGLLVATALLVLGLRHSGEPTARSAESPDPTEEDPLPDIPTP